jgi:hypothetical protein
MGIEALAEAAQLLFPDRHLGAIEDVRFMAPFKFYRNQERTLTLQADFHAEKEDIVADCRLLGSRTLHGQTEPEITTHFTARVRLVTEAAKAARRERVPQPADGKIVEARDIYRIYFHGPAYQVLEGSWRTGNEVVGLFSANLPPNHHPSDLPTLVSPRGIELCFQTASLWELASRSCMGLPYRIEQVLILGSAEMAKTRLYSVVKPGGEGAFDAELVDEKGTVYLALKGYRTAALPDMVGSDLLKPIQSALSD